MPQSRRAVGACARIGDPHDADAVTVTNATFLGRVVVATGRDADLLDVDNSVFEQLVSANTGLGSDTVRVERGDDTAGLRTTFRKPVRLNTGSQDDTISVGLAGQADKSADFGDDVRVNGGQGIALPVCWAMATRLPCRRS